VLSARSKKGPLTAHLHTGQGSDDSWEALTHYLSEVESSSLIRHDDGYFVAGPPATADVYFFFLDLPDGHAKPHFPALRGALARHRTRLLERIANIQAASGGPPAARWLESCWASRSQSPGGKTGSVFPRSAIENPMVRSGFASYSCQTPLAQDKCITGAEAWRSSKVAEPIDLYGGGEPGKRALEHAASLALPDLR
jgi:hypothetical protein